jgi:predicted GNAT family acetyltransferase
MLHREPAWRYILPMDTPSPVRHDPARGAFLVVEDGAESVLEYVPSGPSTVSFVHTFVPPALRGRGIAEQLVAAGLAWARAQGLRVIASCSYVAAYLSRHPEWDALRR